MLHSPKGSSVDQTWHLRDRWLQVCGRSSRPRFFAAPRDAATPRPPGRSERRTSVAGEEQYAFHGVTSIDNPLPVDEKTLFFQALRRDQCHRVRADGCPQQLQCSLRVPAALLQVGNDLTLSPYALAPKGEVRIHLQEVLFKGLSVHAMSHAG